mgnify:CR=1 FL=1
MNGDASIAVSTVEWRISDEPVPYPEAEAEMRARAAAIRAGQAAEQVWLLQHPPLYTAGVSARPEELVDADGAYSAMWHGRSQLTNNLLVAALSLSRHPRAEELQQRAMAHFAAMAMTGPKLRPALR